MLYYNYFHQISLQDLKNVSSVIFPAPVLFYSYHPQTVLLRCVPGCGHIPRNGRDRRKSDPAVLPEAEIRGLQQAVLEEADVQGVCSCEKWLRQMARLRDVGYALRKQQAYLL